VTVADGVGASVDDRVPMVVIGREGADARFVAVLEPVRTGAAADVTGVRIVESDDVLTISVEHAGGRDEMKVFPERKPVVNVVQR